MLLLPLQKSHKEEEEELNEEIKLCKESGRNKKKGKEQMVFGRIAKRIED